MNTLADRSVMIATGYAEDSAVDAALSWATPAISGYCGRNFDYVVNDLVEVAPGNTVALPDYPVTDIASVEAFTASRVASVFRFRLANGQKSMPYKSPMAIHAKRAFVLLYRPLRA